MNSLSYAEIMRIIQSNVQFVSEFAYIEDYDAREILESKLGKITLVDEYGGAEGDGELFYRVYKFEDHDVHIRVHGTYSSYNGVDFDGGWDECSHVSPKTKTIIAYE